MSEKGPPLDTDVDIEAIARRVVARLRPSNDIKDDLLQQAVVIGIDLLRRFQPRCGPDQPDPRDQAERYLYVSLLWNLRAYARRIRSSTSISDRDRKVIAAYNRLRQHRQDLSLDEAAGQLRIDPRRLRTILAASEITMSLDQPYHPGDADETSPLSDRLASDEPSPEEALLATIDEQHALLRHRLLETVVEGGDIDASVRHRDQARHVLYLVFDQLGRGEAEIIRLAFALPRKELGTIRSCRAYGCRRERGHRHEPSELARWLHADPQDLSRRLADALDNLRELLGGRDPRRLLDTISLSSPGATARGERQHPPRRRLR